MLDTWQSTGGHRRGRHGSASSTPASTTPTPTSAAPAPSRPTTRPTPARHRRRSPRPPRSSAATTSSATTTTPTRDTARPTSRCRTRPQPAGLQRPRHPRRGHGGRLRRERRRQHLHRRLRHADQHGLLDAMKIGPGMAPEGQRCTRCKVFGCEGSTDVVIPALDWALDPNGDGDFSDHLDIVNMSLGSDYGPADDPENAVIDELAEQRRARRSSPPATPATSPTSVARRATRSRSLAVASTVDAYQLRDGLKVNAPADVAGHRRRPVLGRLRLGDQRARRHRRRRAADPGRQRRRLRSRSPPPTRPRSTARSPGWSGTTTTPPGAAARSRGPATSRRPAPSAPSSPRRWTSSAPASPATPTIPVVPAAQGGHRQAAPGRRGRHART